jgi:(1->4)-alpha-D-glucan 1-alpha-D-glucosylmutase
LTVRPTSTYRLQLRAAFGFRDAAAVVPYLAELGVSHVYCSPVLEAVPGSAHGYDVVDHQQLSQPLGGDAGWDALVAACRTHRLGLVVDVVPNHMALPTPEHLNAAYWDLLSNGQASAYASWFDVDWTLHDGKLLVPVLGTELDAAIAAGDLVLDGDLVRYFDHVFPVAVGTTADGVDLAELLAAQHYRLAHWATASTGLNYRRFFDVTTLAGLRAENEAVFTATHARIVGLLAAGDVDGLRIDHPDGLADPGGYLDRLAAVAGDRWVVVEKILEPGESLPQEWRCDGTTGYDALRAVTQVLADTTGETKLTETYRAITGAEPDFEAVVEASKRQVLDQLFQPEVDRLVRAALAHTEALDPARLRTAIVELLVAHDVYRTYPGDPASMDRLASTVERAAKHAPGAVDEIRWLGRVLRRDEPGADALAIRFEQTTGPVMAKGVEDTAFYRYLRLVALNEVGGDPGHVGSGIDGWHRFCADLARDWPETMTTLSTHDTKRSEDVRARLLVLAEIPADWASAVARWQQLARGHRPPDPATDYLFWQTLVGAWPVSVERMQAYLAKATHEAKLATSWLAPDEDYDADVARYAAATLADGKLMADVERWCRDHLDAPGRSNAISAKVLQLTMPGIPDVYQGQECTEPTLVDPDNRRPVDYAARIAALADLAAAEPKLQVTARILRLRRDRPAAFRAGYEPGRVTGPAADHAVAYLRGPDVAVVATRLPAGLSRRGGWEDTAIGLPAGDWHDVLADRPAATRLGDLLADMPGALLVRASG